MIKYEDMLPEERERYDRGEVVVRQIREPGDPPSMIRMVWAQKMDFGKSYEEWRKENGLS